MVKQSTVICDHSFVKAQCSQSGLACGFWQASSEQVVGARCVSDPLSLPQDSATELPGAPAAILGPARVL